MQPSHTFGAPNSNVWRFLRACSADPKWMEPSLLFFSSPNHNKTQCFVNLIIFDLFSNHFYVGDAGRQTSYTLAPHRPRMR